MTTQATTASTTRITAPPATSGMGWLQGTASQVSLPTTLVSSPCWANGRCVAACLRAWARREFLIGDVVEQVGRDRPIGERRHVLARLQQRKVTRCVERQPRLSRCGYPLLKAVGRDRVHDEVHARKTVAAELARLSVKLAGLVCLQP